jgi:hypothetical protein
MFAGHVGVGLVIARAEPRVNVGVFVAAALLLDIVLWLLVLAGWESVAIPADFAATHQPDFVFPYSHSLAAGLGWSALAAVAMLIGYPELRAAKWRVAVLVAAAVFSHWILDVWVHRAELPLMGGSSPKVGFGLWDSMPTALAVEAAIVVAGLLVFMPVIRPWRGRALALVLFVALVLAFTVVGMTVAPAPPSAVAMAGSSLFTLVLVCALVGWLGKRGRERWS